MTIAVYPFISALMGTVLCFLIMFMISYKYAALAVGKLLIKNYVL